MTVGGCIGCILSIGWCEEYDVTDPNAVLVLLEVTAVIELSLVVVAVVGAAEIVAEVSPGALAVKSVVGKPETNVTR